MRNSTASQMLYLGIAVGAHAHLFCLRLWFESHLISMWQLCFLWCLPCCLASFSGCQLTPFTLSLLKSPHRFWEMVNFWCLFARTFCMRSPPEWKMCVRSLTPIYFQGCPKCSSHLRLNTSNDQRAHYQEYSFKQHLHLGHVHSPCRLSWWGAFFLKPFLPYPLPIHSPVTYLPIHWRFSSPSVQFYSVQSLYNSIY